MWTSLSDHTGKPGMKTLVVGLGNPILGDDGVGWRVAETVGEQLGAARAGSGNDANPSPPTWCRPPVEVDCLAVGGLALMERLAGYDRVILADALVTGRHPLGTVLCVPLEELPNRALGHLGSAHDTTLHNALRVGRSIGAQLPEDITVVGVESRYVYDFSEDLTPMVAAAVRKAVQVVMALLPGSPATAELIHQYKEAGLQPGSSRVATYCPVKNRPARSGEPVR
jgi:hydrogenase maturation protease